MTQVPVAVIAERLRGQSLEDEPLQKTQRDGTLQIEGKNVWMASGGDTSKDQEGSTTTTTTISSCSTTTTTTTTITRERGMTCSTSLPFLPPHHDNERMMVASNTYRSSPPGGFLASPRFHPAKPAAVRVRSSGGGQEFGARCWDHNPRAFETPPKKKQCRSLSVPVDSPPHGLGLLTSSSAFVEGAKVWRPIPITALTSGSSTPCSTASAPQSDPRTLGTTFAASPDARTFSSFTAVGSTAARFYRDFKVVGSGGGGGGTSAFPLAPSPLSVDSGRDTTSEPHTPSQSPVPRPASASSVRSSHAFCTSAWWTPSPGRFRGGEVFFPSRSESYEEQISMGFQASAVGGGASSGSSPCVVGSGVMGPLSPCRSKIPRCHSQPCVLHHRRYAKKRRRDDRPTLDFHKMTETAYSGNSGISVTPAQDIQKRRWGYELDTGLSLGGLMPIASSPRDSDLPAPHPRSADLHPARAIDPNPAARDSDLRSAARAGDLYAVTLRPTDLPTTRGSDLHTASHATDLHTVRDAMADLDIAARARLPSTPPPSDVSSGIDISEPVKLIGEEEEDELEELEELEEDSNCDCHRDSDRDDNRGLFPLTDLDLEQIENH